MKKIFTLITMAVMAMTPWPRIIRVPLVFP